MTPYSGSSAGPFNGNISLVDTTDVVLGGLGGTANVATKQLADNDAYLYKIMGGFEGTTVKSNAGPILTTNLSVSDLKRKIVEVQQAVNGYFECVLPSTTLFTANNMAVIRRLVVGHGKPLKITATGENIYGKYGSLGTSIYLHDGEIVWLLSLGGGGGWIVMKFEGNLYNVGDPVYSYAMNKPGALMRIGQVVNRADYPRLWSFVQTYGASGLLVPEGTWTSSSGYRGRFSDGDGVTTFRLPDDRGLFDRALDMGAGVDAERVAAGVHNVPGSFEPEAFAAHTHGITQSPHTHGVTDTGHQHFTLDTLADTSTTDAGNGDRVTTGASTTEGLGTLASKTRSATTGIGVNAASISISNNNAGGLETRPVNVGKVPWLIY